MAMETLHPAMRAIRPPLEPSLRGTGLPFSVLRGIVAENRFRSPANRDPSRRRDSRAIAERLGKLPKRLWRIEGVDWRLHARRIDGLAQVAVRQRTPAEARDHTATIANSLRKAAGLLQKPGQLDPALRYVLDTAKEQHPEQYASLDFVPRLFRGNKVALSELFLFLASWYDQGGPTAAAWPMPLPERVGVRASARLAFDRLAGFFEEETRQPHHDLVTEIVETYYPAAAKLDELDFVRGRNQRKKRQKKS